VGGPEAELLLRIGDIDNLGFGWPRDFNPFSGRSTPPHSFPWRRSPDDPSGTDRIIADDTTDAGRALNRRVEVTLLP
jgi:hypothetical protein